MTKRLFVRVFLACATALVSGRAWAFPDMIRHGYVNCTACHVSPSGGGALTEYGRQLSGDLLSTWSKEGEGQFAYGAFKSPSWLNFGGDIRDIAIYRNTPQVSAIRAMVMQADVEVAVSYRGLTADAAFGTYMNFQAPQSRRFYLLYHASDELSLRVGKFQQAYGLMEPDHTTAIRRGLGWDEGTETYNLEVAWLGERLNLYATGNLGPLDSSLIPDSTKERGGALRLGVPLSDRYQVGAGYFHGVSQLWNRDVAGPFAVLGFTHHFFLMSELDLQWIRSLTVPSSTGWVTWNKLDYEFIQGLHGYLVFQLTRPDFADSSMQKSAWGIGSQFFPRPHVECDLLWQLQSLPGFPDSLASYATLLVHYYL